jgi:hypothetical protein
MIDMDTRVMKMTPEVIAAIDGELAYVATLQDQGRSDAVHYGTEGQLLTLSTYTRRAVDAWVNNPSDGEALEELRKCAAIAIRALLTEGCPTREVL